MSIACLNPCDESVRFDSSPASGDGFESHEEETPAPAQTPQEEKIMRQKFNAHVAEDYDRLLRFARHLCGNADHAEDLVLQTLARAWKYFHKFDPSRGSFYTIARIQLKHIFYDNNRYGPKQKPLSLDDPNLPHDRSLVSDTLHENVEASYMLAEVRKRLDPQQNYLLQVILDGGNVQDHARQYQSTPSALYQAMSIMREAVTEIRAQQEEAEIVRATTTTKSLFGIAAHA